MIEAQELKVGDLLYAKGLVTIWSGYIDYGNDSELFGHENCVKKAWMTVLEVKASDDNTRGHFTKVWLHNPIWGSYTHTIRYIGWVWTEHARERLNLHKM